MNAAEQHAARLRIEAAAEIDPDTYVPILDMLDDDTNDLECEECEPEDLEAGDELPGTACLQIVEYCPCCGSQIGVEFWAT